ncbi:tape measure protein [Aurantimonas sp. NFXS3]|uniref:tape measure protein n=1 Tax=Aurantimonas sp. NFXS3 TaxID=2818434 RepID=UPI003B8BFFC5
MIVDELVAILGFDVRGEGELRKFNQGLDGAERKARSFSKTLVALGGAAIGALGGLAIGRQVGEFVSSIATVNAQFETYEATLKTITGSAEEARRSMDWITEFGRTTPYEAGQVTEAFVRLKSYGIDPMDGSLRTVGDAASAMGKSLMSGVEAIADAVTGENERLKEFGVRASAEGENITYTWTENGKVLTKTVKKDAVQIQKALMGIFGRFNGAMDEQSKTWVGMTSNLSDSWTEFLREIGDAGYYDDIKRRLQGTLDFVNTAFESGMVADVAGGISRGLIAALNTTTHLATQAWRVGAAFFHAADGVLDLTSRVTGLSKGMSAAGLGAGLLASSAMGRGILMAVARRVPFVAAALAMDDIISGLNGDNSLVGSTEAGQQALDGLKEKFTALQTAATGFADSLGSVRDRIAEALTLPDMPDLGVQMEGILARPAEMIDRTLKSFEQLVTDPGQYAIDLMTTGVNNLSAAMENVASVLTALSSPIESIKSAIESLKATLASLDAMLPGAGGTAQANPGAGKVATTGQTTRAPSSSGGSTGMVDLIRSGAQTVEGMKAEYGLTEEAIMKVALDLSQFLAPANQALAIQADLSRGVNAVANLDISQWMANADRAETRLRNLQAAAGGASGAVRSRPQVAQSAAAP